MLKRIATLHSRQELERVLNAVQSKGEQFIVERKGKPLAAVVPADTFIRREQARQRLLVMVRRDTPGNRMTEEAVDRLVAGEIRKARRRKVTR